MEQNTEIQEVKATPKFLKKKLTLPITGEIDLPESVKEAMRYRVEVQPVILGLRSQSVAESGEMVHSYEVLRVGNTPEEMPEKFSPVVDRVSFPTADDPKALENALAKAKELAAQKLDMSAIIPGYEKADEEKKKEVAQSFFGKILNDPAPEQSVKPEKESAEPEKSAKPAPASDKPAQRKAQEQTTDEIMQDFPKPQPVQPLSMAPQSSRAAEFEHRKKPDVLLSNPRGKPLVLDYGDRISVTRRAMLGFGRSAQEKREHAVQTALQAAAQRFGQPVHFQGNPAFLRETAAQAVKLGIALEPHDKLAAEIYRQAQERAERERHPQVQNSLGQSQEAKREISKQLDGPTKSKGLGLSL